ncbi:hypothetical protein [Ruegeria conchae]|uniref:hypothetical protein n=1 Tax=Ruegeria conchae TaxID=981384 RepID=UPI000237B252|nr:hypothetical protein [Ruegeria conchae]
MPIDIMFDTGDMMSAPRGPDCAGTATVFKNAWGVSLGEKSVDLVDGRQSGG